MPVEIVLSAFLVEIVNIELLRHQPSIEDIKITIDSMGRGIDTRKVDVYCIRFGQCIPTATETHSDNLLHRKKSY